MNKIIRLKDIELNPRISVIVPVYNVQNYLERCIESVLNQTFKNFELILVNDGSTDNSLNICKRYKKDNRIKIISQKNKGLSAARNKGLELAQGEYVSFIDSDDFVEKDYLKLLFENINKYSTDIAMCEYFLTNEKGKKYSIVRFNEPKTILVLSGRETLKYSYEKNGTSNIVAWNKIYKKTMFNNIKYKEGSYFEDDQIAGQLFYTAKRVSFVHQPLYNYVQRSNSIIHSSWNLKKYKDQQSIFYDKIKFFKGKDLELYKLSIQQYKHWIIELNNIDTSTMKLLNLQKDYRHYFGIMTSDNPRLILEDILGFINIRMISKLKKIVKQLLHLQD